MRYKNKSKEPIIKYFFCLFSLIALVFAFATSNKKNIIVASNINTVKAIESSRIKVIETKQEKEVSKYKLITSIDDIKEGSSDLIEFTGTITGYGPDCVGCSGILACPPNSNVNNNIYYNDNTYGTVRILAADSSIPCGSIVKVSNYDNQEFLGIVLDRGKDIQGLTMDLLFESENSIINLGRKYDINFKIERWGY